jgi:hypothetical protein
MNLRCTECGFRAADRGFYRKEPGGLLGLNQWVCAGCSPYQCTKTQRSVLVGALVSQLFWPPAVYGLASDPMQGIAAVAFVEALIFSGLLTASIHELGHALGAQVAGLRVLKVTVGSGPRRYAVRHGKTTFELRRYGLSGGETRFVDLRDAPSRARRALGIAGGPLANLSFALVAMGLAYLFSDHTTTLSDETRVGDVAVAILTGLSISQLWAALYNLWPFHRRASRSASDGSQLLALFDRDETLNDFDQKLVDMVKLLAAGEFEASAEAIADLREISPDEPYLLSMSIHCISRADGDAQAHAFFLANRASFDRALVATGEEQRVNLAFMCANIAWSALKAGGPDALAVGEAYATRADGLGPSFPEIRGTLGAVRVLQGAVEEGRDLLADTLRRTADLIDKADYSAFLTKAEHALGNHSTAASLDSLRSYYLAQAAAFGAT